MQRKRILVACLGLLLVGLALPSAIVPRAHAFHNNITVSLSGLIRGFPDPSGGTVDAAQAGSTLSVTTLVQATNVVYQRNVTVGFKGDWMTQYQNATNANPSATMPLTANQAGSATISVNLPATGGPGPTHTWTVAVWDGKANTANPASCTGGDTEKANACVTVNQGQAGYRELTLYTADQFAGAQASIQANAIDGGVDTAIANLQFHTNTPGVTAASGQIAQANAELSLGDQSWRNGDFAGAKTHYQNALNDANAAAGSLTNQGGGVDNATLVNLLLGGTGIALIGVGALFAGLGGFFYLRRKPKA